MTAHSLTSQPETTPGAAEPSLLCLRVEPRKPHRGERADSFEARIGKVLLRCKVLEPFCKLVPRIENEHIASSVESSRTRSRG
jgi:hypothetical protein